MKKMAGYWVLLLFVLLLAGRQTMADDSPEQTTASATTAPDTTVNIFQLIQHLFGTTPSTPTATTTTTTTTTPTPTTTAPPASQNSLMNLLRTLFWLRFLGVDVGDMLDV
ncbi:uncharacterized protein LOC143279540 [Babylonia areolata]|uniref:uncharacterized protein LOC143279540 n=1 Tax=Babylonia areolata TaxID=304850 RepID=UPI003FCF02E4